MIKKYNDKKCIQFIVLNKVFKISYYFYFYYFKEALSVMPGDNKMNKIS